MNARPLYVLAALAAATTPNAIDEIHAAMRGQVAKDPAGSVLYTVLAGAWLFYKAEKGKNPKVNSYHDALVYVSTCLSVGYGDIFAQTPSGKLIGSALMTYGPALSGVALDPPKAAVAP
jgi:voltage-gated potassium channel